MSGKHLHSVAETRELIWRLHLDAVEELLRLILAIRLLVRPALAFDVRWAHTLRTGLKERHPSITLSSQTDLLTRLPIHRSLRGLQETHNSQKA